LFIEDGGIRLGVTELDRQIRFAAPVCLSPDRELITGALADDPWRIGKPLHGPYEGLHAARRGTYRILYKIDEGKHAIEIRSIRHRADAYRT
jgi:hypothetical protein